MIEKDALSTDSIKIASHVQRVVRQYRWAEITGFQEDEKGILSVDLLFEVALPSRSRQAGITSTGVRKIEPVSFRFYNYPLFAPSPRLRGDFNRNLPHVNPSYDESYVSPCLFIGGNLSDLMHREDGLIAVLRHMKVWLDRAARDGLYDENVGWEAILTSSKNGFFIADLEDTSQVAVSTRPINMFSVVSMLSEDGKKCYVKLYGELNTLPKNPFPNDNKKITPSLAFVVWGEEGQISKRRDVASISSLGDIYEWLSILKVKGFLRSRIRSTLKSYKKQSPEETLNFFVIVAVPRPVHISGTKSNFEFLPFWIQYPLELKDDAEAPATALRHHQDITPAIAARLSGVSHQNSGTDALPIVMLGCGSLGSKLALHLAKAGTSPFHLIDDATYQPHNAIRHGLISTSSKKKVALLKEELKGLGVDTTCDDNNIVLLLQRKMLDQKISNAKLIIDSTASAQVRQALSLTLHPISGRIVSTAFHLAGKASHLLLEGTNRNPRIDDLYAFMLSEAVHNDSVRKILFSKDSSLRPHPIGQGCASVTMIMSDAAASVHAAGNAKILLKYITSLVPESGECWLSMPDTVGVGSQWHRNGLKETIALPASSSGMDGWEVRILAPAVSSMENECGQRQETETGGALFGQINSHLRRIIVTSATPPPPDSKYSKHEFIMGTEGLREATERVERHTHANLTFLGTWHSHTAETPPSITDRTSLNKFASLRQGPPFVMLIRTPSQTIGIVKSDI